MTKCYQRSFEFPRVNRRIVEARFDGGDITSDGGVLLLRQADRLTGWIPTESILCSICANARRV